ncbi:MAG: DUF493 domain-containing protein [Anaerolineae bacterium]
MMPERQELLRFPSPFTLKVIGWDADEFQAAVVKIVRDHVSDLRDDQVSCRRSAGARYLAVTISFIAASQEQLDALYRELGRHKDVVMLL